VIVAGGMCWMLGWDQGAATIGIAAANSSLFAFLDDPRPVYKMLLVVSAGFAIPIAALYVFAVFPALDGPVALALAVAPLLFFISLYIATPKLGPPAFGFAIVWLTLVSFQPLQTGDFWSFTPTAVGSLLGTTIALVVTSLVRVISVETRVRGLLRAAWRDLAGNGGRYERLSRATWGSRMLDRIGLLLPRTAGTSGVLRDRAGRALDDLRIGVNMLDLRHAGSRPAGSAHGHRERADPDRSAFPATARTPARRPGADDPGIDRPRHRRVGRVRSRFPARAGPHCSDRAAPGLFPAWRSRRRRQRGRAMIADINLFGCSSMSH
jgi:uncharacterized membrane protein YccC